MRRLPVLAAAYAGVGRARGKLSFSNVGSVRFFRGVRCRNGITRKVDMDKTDGGSPPADALVIFGITGDLVYKMIFPALYAMAKHGALAVPVIGVAGSPWSVAEVRTRARDSIAAGGGIDDHDALERLLSALCYVSGDYADPVTFTALNRALCLVQRSV